MFFCSPFSSTDLCHISNVRNCIFPIILGVHCTSFDQFATVSFSKKSFSDEPIRDVHPSAKFSFLNSGRLGNVSKPSCVNFNLVLFSSGNNSNVTNELPSYPSYRQLYVNF